MAVSKTQNERPAITALIDAVNMAEPIVAQNVQNIATLTQGLADELNNRETADSRLDEAIQDEAEARAQAIQAEATARAQAVQGVNASLAATNSTVESIDNTIGDGVFSSSFTISRAFQQAGVELQNMSNALDDIDEWRNRFRLGLTTSVTATAGGSTSGTLEFATPFDSSAEVAVFLVCVDGSENLTDLSCKLISANYSGFSFTVYNDTQADVNIKVGFLAVRMN